MHERTASQTAARREWRSRTLRNDRRSSTRVLPALEEHPVALPCQALDHASGYLLACGVLIGLRRRQREGRSWRIAVSLARTARWLDDLGRVDDLSPFTAAR
jgi:hypothetical protein